MAAGLGSINKGTGRARNLIRALPLALVDAAAAAFALMFALWGEPSSAAAQAPASALAAACALSAACTVAVFAAARMYSTLWQYASTPELVRVAAACALSCLASWLLTAAALGAPVPARAALVWLALVLAVCGATRFAIRISSTSRPWSLLGVRGESQAPRSLVVGAGETGSLTVRRMQVHNPDMPGCPVVMVDDDPAKAGGQIHGVPVRLGCENIPALCRQYGVEQVVVAAPSATRAQRDRIFAACMEAGVRTLTLPMVRDMPQDPGARVALREVEISDLLAREENVLDIAGMGYVAGRNVLVTGGGGSIGSELVRQLVPARPALIVVFDIYENTAYELYHEVRGRCEEAGVALKVFIGSITHLPALEKCFDHFRPDVVFHAAAHKHVPLMEACAREAVENNVFGTLNVVRLAHERGCTHFVLVSTDKAVNPVNVMGATKRMCEIVVQYYASISKTVFTAVRFGNVLGSHGSVIPLFKRQMREGGPITVTHKDITRYFMTIPEASRLVITAGALAKGGEIFVLDMGEPVRIWDLAENLVRLSGLKPGRDIEIVETGLRPGEKMYEELLMETETLLPTANKDIRISTGDVPDLGTVSAKLDMLEVALNKENDAIKRALAEAVPTYHPQFQHIDRENG